MAKNTGGDGKGMTKNISAASHEAARRAAKARRRHSSGAGIARATTHLFAEVASDRRKQRLENENHPDEHVLTPAEKRMAAQRQSEHAVKLINRWTMTDGARRIATAVAKAFLVSHRTEKLSRTSIAKDMVRNSWNTNPALQEHVSREELNKGLRIGGAALSEAGKITAPPSTAS